MFELSNYAKYSKFINEANKKVIGKMKDVPEEKINHEFVRLKSKMYSIRDIDGIKSRTAKEVDFATEFNEFKNTIFNKRVLSHKMKRIKKKKHKMGTYEVNKISLSCFDDKRFVLDDGIHRLAYFHKDKNFHK